MAKSALLEIGLAGDDDANNDSKEPKRTPKNLNNQDLHEQSRVCCI